MQARNQSPADPGPRRLIDEMSTPTDLKRKASARKAQATQKRNEATRAQTTTNTTRARAEAERQQATARALTAARAVDLTLGGAEAARDRVNDALEDLRKPRTLMKRATDDARKVLDDFETRGAVTRRKLSRDATRRAKQVRDRVPV